MFKRFYVEYTHDAGHLMQCHFILQAETLKEAKATWADNISAAVVYREQGPDACFELPAFMADWSNDQVLKHYGDTSFNKDFVAPEDRIIPVAITRTLKSPHFQRGFWDMLNLRHLFGRR